METQPVGTPVCTWGPGSTLQSHAEKKSSEGPGGEGEAGAATGVDMTQVWPGLSVSSVKCEDNKRNLYSQAWCEAS